MNGSSSPGEKSERQRPQLPRPFELGLLLALFCVPALIGMARHPLWVDEAFTLFPLATNDPSLGAFIGGFFNFPGSIQFTPLHSLLVAIWARTVPPTELALRCMNLPFLIGIAFISRALMRRLAVPSAAARWLYLAFVGLSPFYLYYSYDLRPYVSLICFGGMILLGLLLWEEWRASGPWLVIAGFSLAFLTQPTVLLLAPIICLGIFLYARQDFRKAFQLWIIPGIVGGLTTAAGGVFYHIVRSGGGMQFWGGGGFMKNVIFVLYEFMGFSGLGPTRSQLRAIAPPSGVESTLAPVQLSWPDWLPAGALALVWLLLIGVIVHAIFAGRIRRLWSISVFRWSSILFFGGLLVLSIFFYLINYRFQARHASFLYLPFIVLVVSCVVQASDQATTRFIFLTLLGAFALSSGRLLFDPAYMREDPRGLVEAWRRFKATVGSADLWAFYPPESMIYYVKGKDLLVLSASGAYRYDRIGPATFRKTELSEDVAQEHFANADIVSLMRLRRRELWQRLVESHRGKIVVIAVNRGTEFDPENFSREIINNPAAHARKLGEWPFVECYQCIVP